MNKEKRKDATVDEPVRLKVLEQPMRLKSVVEQPVRLKSMGDQPVRLKAMSMVKEIDDEPVRLKTMVDEPVRFSAKENSSLVRGEMYRVRDEYPGKNYATGIRFAVSEELHQVLDHIDMKETLCLTAIPGGGVLYSMMDGSTYWKLEEANPTNLPDVVDKALRTRSGEHSRLTSVAFGHGAIRTHPHETGPSRPRRLCQPWPQRRILRPLRGYELENRRRERSTLRVSRGRRL